jgi:hypothetical protein
MGREKNLSGASKIMNLNAVRSDQGTRRGAIAMSRYDHAYILTPGGPAGARSFCIVVAAIAAICVLSATPVIRQLAGSPPSRELVDSPPATAKTAASAPTWDFQSRWWSGEVRQVTPLTRQSATVAEEDLTFTKGYQLRLAARQAASAARPAASGPSSESQFGRSAMVVRTAGTFARIDGAPSLRRVVVAHTDALVDRPGAPDIGSHALAFGEQRPSQRGFADSQGGPFRNLFGNLY